MRIGLVLYGELSSPSGGFLYDRFLVEALRGAGHDVDTLSLPWPSWSRGVAMGRDAAATAALRAWDGDLMVQDELAHPTLSVLNPVLRAGKPGRRIVSIVHHLRLSEDPPLLSRARVRRVEKRYLESVDGFLFNSTTTRSVVESFLGRPVPGTIATPGGDRLGPGPTAAEVEERCRRPGPLHVLFAGTFIPRKGLHTLIDALAVLPRGSWRLTAAGARQVDPGYTRLIDRRVAALGLRDAVSFPGHLDERSLTEAFRSHQVLAVPSSYEGFGIVYLEAMGFGVVPLASRHGGGAEIVSNGVSGLLVEPGSAREIADGLGSLAADRGKLARMATAARERFAAFPGWKASMDGAVAWLGEQTAPRDRGTAPRDRTTARA
jgi:glycosyltransferase involved in cell wall biosynthesis